VKFGEGTANSTGHHTATWAAPGIWSWGQRGGKGQGTGGNGNQISVCGLWAKCRPGLELLGGGVEPPNPSLCLQTLIVK